MLDGALAKEGESYLSDVDHDYAVYLWQSVLVVAAVERHCLFVLLLG